MIQDITPNCFANHYIPLNPEPDSNILVFCEGKLLTHYDAEKQDFVFPHLSDFSGDAPVVYAFSISDEKYFMMMGTNAVPDGFEAYTLRDLRSLKQCSTEGIFIAYTAWHLWTWYKSSRFCGCCGEKTEFDTVERAVVCPKCGNKIYPRINPAVIVGVTNGDEIVLTKYKTGFGFNALIAGFTEFGETLEETVQREVMEEVGLHVKNIRYYKSQPWGIASDILMGFYCEVDGDPTIHRDDSELKYAEWVRREDVILQPDSLSLTNEMMQMFKENRDRQCA